LSEIASTRRVVESRGYRFEIAEVNRGLKSGTTLHVSTYRSSLSRNLGNVAELVLCNDEHRVYVSSLGRGGTSELTASEQSRFARTGSLLTNEDGQPDPLPVVLALNEALEAEGIDISRVRSDSSGRMLTAALAWCRPNGAISTIMHNAPPHVAPLGRLPLATRLLYEDHRLVRPMTLASPDPDRIDSSFIDWVRVGLPSSWPQAPPHRDGVTWSNFLGLARPSRSVEACPLALDLRAVRSRHNRARTVLLFGALDPLFTRLTRSDLERLATSVSDVGTGQVAIAVVPTARHNAHAAFPRLYQTIESMLQGSADDDTEI
jgi:hypothetical protein